MCRRGQRNSQKLIEWSFKSLEQKIYLDTYTYIDSFIYLYTSICKQFRLHSCLTNFLWQLFFWTCLVNVINLKSHETILLKFKYLHFLRFLFLQCMFKEKLVCLVRNSKTLIIQWKNILNHNQLLISCCARAARHPDLTGLLCSGGRCQKSGRPLWSSRTLQLRQQYTIWTSSAC